MRSTVLLPDGRRVTKQSRSPLFFVVAARPRTVEERITALRHDEQRHATRAESLRAAEKTSVTVHRRYPAHFADPDLGPDGKPARAYEARLGDTGLAISCDSHGNTTSFGRYGDGDKTMRAEDYLRRRAHDEAQKSTWAAEGCREEIARLCEGDEDDERWEIVPWASMREEAEAQHDEDEEYAEDGRGLVILETDVSG